MNVEQVMTLAPVIPVLVVHDVAHARPIAEALVEGGLPALEVTLRTPCALDVIREMAKVEGAVVGAGTVLNPDDVRASVDAGARFLVSPGLTEPLANAAIASQLPFLPGTANAGDIMRGLDMGLTHFKFFPAMTNGGIPALKALAAPLFAARFCPTGGITEQTAADWLALDAVLCVGGSWVVPAGTPDVAEIVKRARAAAALRG
ncbi:bifunctional 4-hydroxy-2-oxoglutarate aldolase/2-dehydro-3-deoxy-phosphogluconate aldolase [Sphingomonadaceae bacterium G21617-S1]|jgi:2-dehydro-3-deoxyphosphogluconate aldolase/(4S)-4-hydroxy-2-oxoglutarate aldolase|uniref:bifunctional 4-hydroxy-2-oxoglutarate aldolase/2-dehydro-3-deoxy-phosphogluconate aldolase n=1 Tax=Rhizorhabdus sp. TaxID=1968843 RepID=UPI001213F729|nr:bifunctional 4-hydroxy-2-oxoglutarate aldolase/2-dehydro-3-deoxy-phosphogluconate aldolase [Rhizorhabdus sp.]MBD3760687.1 bifunctional 4-hydroxy-2-oxoglutarate aldolase/2-dehydro-3-deoxy-phosphogluconate aldolase [Rhizorhabdus sp.]MCZ4342492.1 bifunctional 4-hydroxy-2-oxoglutarate aldolase/2-dehydro-3-deoxy-phosphogluconate aldolase [Sphingomonadaceae bacterium G21617-S1]TAK06679.1 MAG: bifunctional 4-hydroxy-2-oxoglutarate aldolase/2-dehydro-3-deoxy-phosphogluconate aldolase [Rhizorhabdus sp